VPIFAQQPSNSLDWDAIHALDGRFNFHDGPNCYNATMIAKGYSTIISQTSDEELKYYLWNFCHRADDPPMVGDILVKTTGAEHEVEHAAAYVGNGKIFEKPGFAGTNGSFARLPPGVFQGDVKFESTYAIRKIEESTYFRNGKENHSLYRCQPLTDVRAKTAGLERLIEFQIIQMVKRMFSNLAFDPGSIHPENTRSLGKEIETVSAIVNQLPGKEEKDLFLYVNAASLWINLGNMRMELPHDPRQPAPLAKEFDRLTSSMNSLADRIRNSRKSPEILFILGPRR
jgi:hypothetical protein